MSKKSFICGLLSFIISCGLINPSWCMSHPGGDMPGLGETQTNTAKKKKKKKKRATSDATKAKRALQNLIKAILNRQVEVT